VRRVEHLDLSDCDTKIAGFIDDDKINALWADKKAKSRLDRTALFSLIASEMAVADSGLDGLSELPVRKGILLGTGCGMVETTEAAYHRFYALQKPRARPTTVPRAMYNAAASKSRSAMKRRISNTAVTACSRLA
jgi:3-oxoacyl-(acyl-carrier-protein) synthase